MFFTTQEKAEKYVIYLRKSTVEQGKQETSIQDQQKYCEQLVENMELNCVDIIIEKESAKKSGERAKFNQMIKDIESGKIDGIVAWHPDRLARNMGDGGKIIELVDSDDITDLRFCTQQFSKDANGKMLLGLAFVLSKQYSDKLSTDVKRGNIELHNRGQAIGREKHGYIINDNGHYIKSPHWDLIKEAWRMRINGKAEARISEWLNDNGYTQTIKKSGIKVGMTPQKINVMFRNTMYFGLQKLKGGNDVILMDHYNFQPMITEDEYWKVQGKRQVRTIKVDKPFYQKVYDAVLPNVNYRPTVAKRKYLIYTVDNHIKKTVDPEVRKKLKGVRAKDLLNAVERVLEDMDQNLKEADYKAYSDLVKQHISFQSNYHEEELRRIKGMITRHENQILELEEGYVTNGHTFTDDEVKAYRKKLNGLKAKIKEFKENRDRIQIEQDDLVPSYESFLNSVKTLCTRYSKADGESRIELAEIIVSNFYVHAGEVLAISFKKPFHLLIDEKSRLAGLSGFEPDLAVLETDVLPLTL